MTDGMLDRYQIIIYALQLTNVGAGLGAATAGIELSEPEDIHSSSCIAMILNSSES